VIDPGKLVYPKAVFADGAPTGWIVAPEPGNLHFAQGQAPTPHGPLASRWRRGGRSFKLTVVAPRGTSGVVEVPLLGRRRTVTIDGKAARGKRRGDAVRFKGIHGQHTFVVG
jgi:hypothetical protein